MTKHLFPEAFEAIRAAMLLECDELQHLIDILVAQKEG